MKDSCDIPFLLIVIVSFSVIYINKKTWPALIARRVGVFPLCIGNGYISASFVFDSQVNCLLFYYIPAYEVLRS